MVSLAFDRPAAFVNQSMMRPAKQGEIRERRLPTSCPPDEMMCIAPDRGPPAARPDAAPVARPPSRRRYGTAGVVALVSELGLAGHSYECGVARIALYGFRRYRSAGFQFAGGRARDSGQRVHAGANDQLWPRTRAVVPAARPLTAALDDDIG